MIEATHNLHACHFLYCAQRSRAFFHLRAVVLPDLFHDALTEIQSIMMRPPCNRRRKFYSRQELPARSGFHTRDAVASPALLWEQSQAHNLAARRHRQSLAGGYCVHRGQRHFPKPSASLHAEKPSARRHPPKQALRFIPLFAMKFHLSCDSMPCTIVHSS